MLHDISLDVRAGEVLFAPTSGTIYMDGKPAAFATPRAAADVLDTIDSGTLDAGRRDVGQGQLKAT